MVEDVKVDDLKGTIKYTATLGSPKPVIKQCPYDKDQRLYRYCLDHFPNKSEWSKVNFTQCRSKTEKIDELQFLNQVGYKYL